MMKHKDRHSPCYHKFIHPVNTKRVPGNYLDKGLGSGGGSGIHFSGYDHLQIAKEITAKHNFTSDAQFCTITLSYISHTLKQGRRKV